MNKFVEMARKGFEGKRIARKTFFRFSPKGKVTHCCPMAAAAMGCGLVPNPDWDSTEQSRNVKNQLKDYGIMPDENEVEHIYALCDTYKYSFEEIMQRIEGE